MAGSQGVNECSGLSLYLSGSSPGRCCEVDGACSRNGATTLEAGGRSFVALGGRGTLKALVGFIHLRGGY